MPSKDRAKSKKSAADIKDKTATLLKSRKKPSGSGSKNESKAQQKSQKIKTGQVAITDFFGESDGKEKHI